MNDTDLLNLETDEIQFQTLSLGIGLGKLKPLTIKPTPAKTVYPESRVPVQESEPVKRVQSIPIVYSNQPAPASSPIAIQDNPYLANQDHENSLSFKTKANKVGFFSKIVAAFAGLFGFLPKLAFWNWSYIEHFLVHLIDCAIVLVTLLVVGMSVSYLMFGTELSFLTFAHQSISGWTARFSILQAFGGFYLAVALYWLTFKIMVGKTLGRTLING